MDKSLKQRIEELIGSSKVFLFMKGTPENPMCGFSMKTSETLKNLGINFKIFDVLSDDSIRQGVKEFANWPTIPQLYIGGKFVGGSAIVDSMVEKGELQKLI